MPTADALLRMGLLDATGPGAASITSNVQRLAGPAAIAATAVAGIGIAAITMASDFDTSIREVNTLLNLPKSAFQELREETLSLSSEIGRSASEVVPSLYNAISAGVPQDNVFDFLRVSNQAAIGGVTSLAKAVDGLTSVTNAYGPDVLSASRASDILFTSVRLGKTTFDELSSSVNQVAPLAAAIGLEFEQVAAAFTTVTTQGVPTTQAMTQVRALMQSLAAPTTRVKATLDDLGITLNQQRLSQEGFIPILDEIITKTDGNASAQRKLFGSVEALSAALILVSDTGAATYNNALDEMRNSTGATSDAAEIMDAGIGRLSERLKAQFSTTLIRIGEQLLPTLIEWLESFAEWFADNEDEIVSVIEGFGNAFETLLEVMARVREDPLFNAFIESIQKTAEILALFRDEETTRTP